METSDPFERRLARQQLESLLAVTRALAVPFDLSTMLAEVAAAACTVLRAERCSVWMYDARVKELVVRIASDLGPIHIPLGQGLVGTCARERVLINVADCYADPRFDPSVDRVTGFHTRCSLTLPLTDDRSALVGVMQVINKEGSAFDADDETLASALAAQCAIALNRARLTDAMLEGERLKQELELAQLVQLSALPHTKPMLPGYELHGTFLPARMTGGDTYDLALVEQGLLIVLGDATGQGIGPALAVTQMHAMLRMALRLGADLQTAFRHVNDQLALSLPDGRAVAAFIGLLDARTHRIRYLSGGQAPILHLRAAQQDCISHGATNLPMGAMPLLHPSPAVVLDLAAGDLLAVLSDGIYEYANGDGTHFGQARVEALLHRHQHESTEVIAVLLLDAVREFAGGAPQADDVTMVLVKRRPAS